MLGRPGSVSSVNGLGQFGLYKQLMQGGLLFLAFVRCADFDGLGFYQYRQNRSPRLLSTTPENARRSSSVSLLSEDESFHKKRSESLALTEGAGKPTGEPVCNAYATAQFNSNSKAAKMAKCLIRKAIDQSDFWRTGISY